MRREGGGRGGEREEEKTENKTVKEELRLERGWPRRLFLNGLCQRKPSHEAMQCHHISLPSDSFCVQPFSFLTFLYFSFPLFIDFTIFRQ